MRDEKLRALADEWWDEDSGIEHVADCQDYACKDCVVIACAADLRAILDAEGQDETTEGQPEEGERCMCGHDADRHDRGSRCIECRCVAPTWFSAAPAPVPDDEAAEARRYRSAVLAAGYIEPEAHAAAVREAVRAALLDAARSIEAMRTASQYGPHRRAGMHDAAKRVERLTDER